MKTIKIKTQFTKATCYIVIARYNTTNNLALMLREVDTGLPFATITVNFSELKEPYAYLDINNCPWIMDLFEKYNLGTWTGMTKWGGYCEYPLYELNLNVIRKYTEENIECSNTRKG